MAIVYIICAVLWMTAAFFIIGGIYMIITKKPVLFHSYHYANMSAKAQGKFAVYGSLGMVICGIGIIGFTFYGIGWPAWMKSQCGAGASLALALTGLAIMFLSIICCKGRAISWIWHWREDQEKNCDD